MGALPSLLRTVLRRDRDLLSILPAEAYEELITPLGYSRRGILLVNAPDEVARILADVDGFPKNDLMVGALLPLVGESMFVSGGERWQRQRRLIEPAFSHMRITRAFGDMVAAVDALEPVLDRHAADGTPLPLDVTMSQLTADIITRTIFTDSLDAGAAHGIFEAFFEWQRHVANVDVGRLLWSAPFARIPQPRRVIAACERIRAHIRAALEARMRPGAPVLDDIAGAAIAARDPATGQGFTLEELVDEVGTFFLAGHETTASALTWAVFLLSQLPAVASAMRAEVAREVGDGPIRFEHLRRLTYLRNVFRETLRLYPPLTFIPRVAASDTSIGGRRVRRGTMVMLSPWTMHRHRRLWGDPETFDPGRFDPDRERTHVPGAYLPFGAGPRVCVGAAFATTESTLILARLVRAYDLEVLDPARVEPVSRLTTRPMREIRCRVRRR